VLTGLIAFGALVIIGAAASATNSPSKPAANTATATQAATSASASSASTAAAPDCVTQAKAWIASGQLTTFGNDVSAFGTALTTLASNPVGTAPASDTAAVQSAAASIESDAQALEASPAPSCIPGLRGDVNAGAKYYSTAAIDATNALNQFSAGNVDTATADMQIADAAMSRGNVKIAAASTDVSRFSASQCG
jgi:trimeric autotransporter adhesin